jgi:hypothetical protein
LNVVISPLTPHITGRARRAQSAPSAWLHVLLKTYVVFSQ